MSSEELPEDITPRKPLPRRLRRLLAAGWVSFLAAAAGLAPSISIIEVAVEVTDGHPQLHVPLSLYSLMFLTLWATAMGACLLTFLLQSKFRNRAPDGE